MAQKKIQKNSKVDSKKSKPKTSKQTPASKKNSDSTTGSNKNNPKQTKKKKTDKKTTPVIHLVEQEEFEIEDEDKKFIKKNALSLSFLANLEPSSLTQLPEKNPKPKAAEKPKNTGVKAPQALSDSEQEDYLPSNYNSKKLVSKLKKSKTKKSFAQDSDIESLESDDGYELNDGLDNDSYSDVNIDINTDEDSDVSFKSAGSGSDSDTKTVDEFNGFESDHNLEDSDSSNIVETLSDSDNEDQPKDVSTVDGLYKKDLSEDSDNSDSSEDSDNPQANMYANLKLKESMGLMNSSDRRKLKRARENSQVMDYELSNRSYKENSESNKKQSLKLPTKDKFGRIVMPSSVLVESGDSDSEIDTNDNIAKKVSDSDSEMDSDLDNEQESKPTKKLGKDRKVETVQIISNTRAFDRTKINKKNMTLEQYILSCQIYIAEVSEAIIENPEDNINKIKFLTDFIQPNFESEDKVKQLALVSLFAIFCDIIPGYRIRELTQKEKETKISKEVKKQHQYEETLVQIYKSFLIKVFNIVEDSISHALASENHGETIITLGTIAIKGMTQLLKTHSHFNFRADIIEKLVSIYIQTPDAMPKVRILANESRGAIIQLLKVDPTGQYSEEATLLASKRIKFLSYKVDPSALRPWLFLPICDELVRNPEDMKNEERQRIQRENVKKKLKIQKRIRQGRNVGSFDTRQALHTSKKQRKVQSEMKEAERDLKVAEAEVNVEERQKYQANTLKHIFVTYFRILKHQQSPDLYPAVLEGLARFAHLISIDFFPDVLAALKKIVRGQIFDKVQTNAKEQQNETVGDELVSHLVSTRSVLLSTLTAIHIITAQKKYFDLDLIEFFNYLYSIIPILACSPEIEEANDPDNDNVNSNKELEGHLKSTSSEYGAWESTVKSESKLFLECLNMLFMKKYNKVSFERVSAFIKRLAAACLYFPVKTAVSCLKFIAELMPKYPDISNMFKGANTIGSGLYLPYVNQVDMSNAKSTCLYELYALLLHHSSKVREQVKIIFKQARKLDEE
ncbi:hypothetical protein BB561_001809 [Smittium simulii]|uniref:Nucleolar complex-associated protein 3 n=1 Tax=Smittium simulii TaxID=133385 RepID=A0A2T9YT67_9FUNG|nr:hypothetical protein BB561_001809 [Smittium simulii]